MIVRVLIRLCLLNTLFSLFIQDNRLGVDAKLCSIATSGDGEVRHTSVKDSVDHVGTINSRVGTSRCFQNSLKIRGGEAIAGKKLKVLSLNDFRREAITIIQKLICFLTFKSVEEESYEGCERSSSTNCTSNESIFVSVHVLYDCSRSRLACTCFIFVRKS